MCRHGTEYSTRSTWAWISGPIFALAQVASTNGSGGQRPQRVLLRRLEHRGRGGAVQRPARPAPGDLGGPAFRLGLHLRQAR